MDEPRLQLDIFEDSADAIAERALQAALRARDPEEARRQREEVARLRPDHPRLADLGALVAGLGLLERPPADPRAHLEELEQHLEPLAQRYLFPDPADYLEPQWQALADRLEGRPFDPGQPLVHRSYALLRAGRWGAMREAVTVEAEWWRQSILVGRHLLAAEGEGDQARSLTDWCRLCWSFADTARQWLDEDTHLGRACRHLPDMDPPWEPVDWPAWYALSRGREVAPPAELADSPAAGLLGAVNALVRAGRAPLEDTLLTHRQDLHERHSRLFELYKKLYAL